MDWNKKYMDLFHGLDLLDDDIYNHIKQIKGKEFTEQVYDNVKKHKYFITNLGKCTQIDAR